MKNISKDILYDYEEFGCQLEDIFIVLDFVNVGYDQKTTSAILATVSQALQKIITDQKVKTDRYRKELKHD
ncbi:hypothetical protein V9Z57_10330 [Streptococcus suis]|uniref:hypothetical protein n=1 Tax=Streptococcus suis TaxID=1307 RepID=UPI000CF44F83|nr:hypothetical protein [Streptococcus suis]